MHEKNLIDTKQPQRSEVMFQYIRLRGNVGVMDNNYFNNEYVSINDVAQAKGLKGNRSIRLELNKPESKYISREVKVNGGTSYAILFSSLEPELQNKLRAAETKLTALVPRNYISNDVITDKAKLTRNHRLNIVKSALQKGKEYEGR